MPQVHPQLSNEKAFDALENLLQSQSEKQTSVLDSLTKLGASTVSIAILHAGTITAKVLGSTTQSLQPSKPFNNDTIFQACSISKSMTSIVVHDLCQCGILSLSAPISNYLSPTQISWISNPQTYALASNITISQLLSHTSGLSCSGFSGYSTSPHPTIEHILRGIPPANNIPVTVDLLPGTKFSYSGGGYTVVQLIIETKLKKPFYEVMHDRLFDPLKMRRSTFCLLSDDEQNFANSFWNGRLRCEPGHHALLESAAAGLWTTPSDILRAVHAVQRSLNSEDGFLERKLARTMLTEIEDNVMALGWMASKKGNHFHHTGANDPGYRCVVAGYADLSFSASEGDGGEASPETPKESGLCIMTSSVLGDIVYAKLVGAVLYLKGWPMFTGMPPVVPLLDRGRVIDDGAKEWHGKWGSGIWEIRHEKEGLVVCYGSLPAMPLVVAAMPSQIYEEGRSIDLVADGLSLMLRLGWRKGIRIVEIWQSGEVSVLTRS